MLNGEEKVAKTASISSRRPPLPWATCEPSGSDAIDVLLIGRMPVALDGCVALVGECAEQHYPLQCPVVGLSPRPASHRHCRR